MLTRDDILASMTEVDREAHLNRKAPNGLRMRDLYAVGKMQEEGTPLTKFKPNCIHLLKDAHFLADVGNYEVEEHELFVYHIVQESRSFHPQTGERLSRSIIQKYDRENFELMINNRGFEGRTICILHDPSRPLTPEAHSFAVSKGWIK